MVDFKSKKIKKTNLDYEKSKIEVQSKTQKTKQSKVLLKLKKNKTHLTISNSKLRKK